MNVVYVCTVLAMSIPFSLTGGWLGKRFGTRQLNDPLLKHSYLLALPVMLLALIGPMPAAIAVLLAVLGFAYTVGASAAIMESKDYDQEYIEDLKSGWAKSSALAILTVVTCIVFQKCVPSCSAALHEFLDRCMVCFAWQVLLPLIFVAVSQWQTAKRQLKALAERNQARMKDRETMQKLHGQLKLAMAEWEPTASTLSSLRKALKMARRNQQALLDLQSQIQPPAPDQLPCCANTPRPDNSIEALLKKVDTYIAHLTATFEMISVQTEPVLLRLRSITNEALILAIANDPFAIGSEVEEFRSDLLRALEWCRIEALDATPEEEEEQDEQNDSNDENDE